MTTDITELAQSLKTAAEKAKHAGEAPIMSFDARIYALNEYQITAFPDNILALVEALEKAQQRIAELEEAEHKLCAANTTLDARAELAERQLAELESRTVTVKLPEPPGPMSVGARTVYFGIVADVVGAFHDGLNAAGIKVEAE